MSIIARRIPSPLAGAESCGPSQQWDPNYVFNGMKGQCTPKGSPMTSGAKGFLDSFMTAFTPKAPAPAPAASSYVTAPVAAARGLPTSTKIAIGVGAVGLVALIVLTRK